MMINEVKPEVDYTPSVKDIQCDKFGHIREKKSRAKLKVYPDANGYSCVELMINGKPVDARVDKIVASFFIPNPDKKQRVNHIDGDLTNNYYKNLEWY